MEKQKSIQLKGIAILMMLWYHLFYSEEVAEICTPLFWIGNEPVAHMIARACYPVTFFLILSGYGLSFLFQQGNLNLKNQFKRILRLYIHYWVVLLIFVTIGNFINPERYIIDYVHLATNITGLDCTYNGETWFLLPYAIICFLAVGFMPWLFRIDNWCKMLLFVGGYAFCFGAMKFFLARYIESFDSNFIFPIILQFANTIFNFFYFSLGVLLFRLINERHLFTVLHPITTNRIAVILLLLIIIAVKTQFKVTLADGIYAFLFIILFLQLPVTRLIAKILENIGHHSMPMWMTHTFFAVYLFPDFIYGFRYPILIFLVLVVVSYLASIPILWVSKHIIKLCSL